MTKVYKYRTGASALSCLSDGTLYFPMAEKLNDILEAKFDFVKPYDFYRECLSGLNVLRKDKGLPLYECSFPSLDKAFFEINEEENRKLYDASRKIGIFSGSIRYDNQALWAYYANDFNGVCFETEWSEEIIQAYNLMIGPVTYSKDQRLINRADDYRDLMIKVGRENPDWSIDQLMEYFQSYDFRKTLGRKTQYKVVSVKHTDWYHEEEVRIISPTSGALPLLKDVLKRVFFVNTSFPNFAPLVSKLYHNYPDVELVRIDFKHTEPFVHEEEYEIKHIPM